MSLPIYLLIGSTIALVIMTGVFRLEDARGKVLILRSVRTSFDHKLAAALASITGGYAYIGRGFIRLILHYAAHGLLQRVLRAIRRLENWVEQLIRQNRRVARSIDVGKREDTSHFGAIAAHKRETALSEREKRRLRAHW